MTDELLIRADARGVAYVTLNRPARHNAFDDKLIAQITQAFAALAADPEVKAVVLAGEGKSFSAGGDLHWMKRMAAYSREENLADAMKLAAMYESIRRCEKPVIVRAHGNVMAGGTGLVAAGDYAVAEESARFQISEALLGLRPSTISSYLIPKIGVHNARVLFTGAQRFSAAEACDFGLVQAVVAAADLDSGVESAVGRALAGGKAAFHDNIGARRDSPEPEPARYALPKDGREINHNKILDLIDGVSARLKDMTPAGRRALMEFTATDIAEARVSGYAQQKLKEFFERQETRAVETKA